MFNTIILKKGAEQLTNAEYKDFSKGDTIMGVDSNPQELGRWSIHNEDLAKIELEKHESFYINTGNFWSIEEYALEYCECDDDGEFVEGSEYEFAKESKND